MIVLTMDTVSMRYSPKQAMQSAVSSSPRDARPIGTITENTSCNDSARAHRQSRSVPGLEQRKI